MRREIKIYFIVLFVLHTGALSAQRVLYSPAADDRAVIQTEVAGKAGDYYWIRTIRKKRMPRRLADSRFGEEEDFDIYDARLHPVATVPSQVNPDTVLKQYFISGDESFDQLVLLAGDKKTMLLLERYAPQGDPVDGGRIIGNLTFSGSGNDFLLIRSEDRTKILLLGFERISSSSPRIHALLFDQDWRILSDRVYENYSFTQPILQDDLTSYPLEEFNKGPVKLANNGQWLMAVPSREDHNFVLFHFDGNDSSFSYKEITLPGSSTMEDVALSVDNKKGEASAGILSRFRYIALKNVRTVHYSLDRHVFNFDSTYRFNTLLPGKFKNDNLVKENFIAVPDEGFMLLKEYGRVFTSLDEGAETYDTEWDPEEFFFNNANLNSGIRFPLLQDGYARYGTLGGLGADHGRGDLGLFYFPSAHPDSCWSGLISSEQVTELNAPDLSYLAVPIRNKLFFLYNNILKNGDLFGSTTIIDHQGNPQSGEGIVFWQINNILLFQRSRQISEDEVAAPYERFQRSGFAIIRF